MVYGKLKMKLLLICLCFARMYKHPSLFPAATVTFLSIFRVTDDVGPSTCSSKPACRLKPFFCYQACLCKSILIRNNTLCNILAWVLDITVYLNWLLKSVLLSLLNCVMFNCKLQGLFYPCIKYRQSFHKLINCEP
jgi:hypothetical protein